MAKPVRIYWDSMLFIYTLKGNHADNDLLRSIIDRAERREVQILTSAFTMCEVSSFAPLGITMSVDDQELLITKFFQNPYITIVQVDRTVAEYARDFSRRFKLQGKDAVHVASAVYAKVDMMHSYDKDILKVNKRVGLPTIPIGVPSWKDGQPPLITPTEIITL